MKCYFVIALLEGLRKYYRACKPKEYLFEAPGKKYGAESVAKIVVRTARKAGITKKVTLPHTLRHSFTTHLLEAGVNLRGIQVLPGHNSTKGREIYTHVASHAIQNIISPLEFLYLKENKQ